MELTKNLLVYIFFFKLV